MQKLLIADSSHIFTTALASVLESQFHIFTCTDGRTALDLLRQHRPDILILNLMLPYKDGLSVLQETEFAPPVILAITMHMSAYVERSVTALGVDYTMIAPSVHAVAERLQDLLTQYQAAPPSAEPLDLVAHHLHQLNFPTHLDGYRQLCIALPLFAENPQQFLTKELYPAVARAFGCKDGRSVEHSVRKAIQAAWKHKDIALWRKYFPIAANGIIPCPSNKEFLCRMAEILNSGIPLL